MAAQSTTAVALDQRVEWNPVRIAAFPGVRALAWHDDVLYASRGYTLLRARIHAGATTQWENVATYRPGLLRAITSSAVPTSRLLRDGFHALAALPSGHLVAAVPHAIVTLAPGETEFRVSHRVLRGTRPLHFGTTPRGHISWGEYFDNPQRDEVHIYASGDQGAHWDVAYTFPRGEIRHVHNVVYDEFEDCFWVLTGDVGRECRILRASCDFKHVDVVIAGSQQARSAALVPTRHAVYFSSDTPLEKNHVCRLDRRGNLAQVLPLNSSSTYGCRAGSSVFFSTMIEPSAINLERNVYLYGSPDGGQWQQIPQAKKDRWPMRFFQYGNAFLPDGKNTTRWLAVTTIALEKAGLETTLWRV
jgi:hypothetical protein